MKPTSASGKYFRVLHILGALASLYLFSAVPLFAQQSVSQKAPASEATTGARGFDTPQEAADVLVQAADKFDTATLEEIFGPSGNDIVFTGEVAQDRQHAANFAIEGFAVSSVALTRFVSRITAAVSRPPITPNTASAMSAIIRMGIMHASWKQL